MVYPDRPYPDKYRRRLSRRILQGERPNSLRSCITNHSAVRRDIWKLLANAKPEGRLTTCRDWSHLADRTVGENWFLCGEAAGFADPIISAGMTLAHQSAREAAYTILELRRRRTRFDLASPTIRRQKSRDDSPAH